MSTHAPGHERRNPWTGWLAWGLCAVYVVGMGFSIGLAFLARGYGEAPGVMPAFERTLLFYPGFLAFALAGALIATRQPRNPVGWLFLASAMMAASGGVAEPYWRYALLVRHGELPGGMIALWVNTRPFVIGTSFDMLLILLFPTGRPLARWWWLAWWLVVVGDIVQLVAEALLPGPLAPLAPFMNPFGLAGAVELLQRANDLGTALVLAGALATLLSLLLRLRRARGVERQQVKLLIPALAVYMAGQSAVIYMVSRPGGLTPATNLAFIAQVFGSLLVAGAAGLAILRHHLFDIDLIIRRTLVYAVVTATLGAIYFGAVVALQGLFVRLTGQESALAVVASTLAIAALFQPLRRRVQAIVDRRFDRTRYDARLVLEQFAARAQREADLDTLSADLLATVDEALKPEQVTLWLTRR